MSISSWYLPVIVIIWQTMSNVRHLFQGLGKTSLHFNWTGSDITADHHCGGEIFQHIFSLSGWKCAEKSLLHSDDQQLYRTLMLCHFIWSFRQGLQVIIAIISGSVLSRGYKYSGALFVSSWSSGEAGFYFFPMTSKIETIMLNSNWQLYIQGWK